MKLKITTLLLAGAIASFPLLPVSSSAAKKKSPPLHNDPLHTLSGGSFAVDSNIDTLGRRIITLKGEWPKSCADAAKLIVERRPEDTVIDVAMPEVCAKAVNDPAALARLQEEPRVPISRLTPEPIVLRPIDSLKTREEYEAKFTQTEAGCYSCWAQEPSLPPLTATDNREFLLEIHKIRDRLDFGNFTPPAKPAAPLEVELARFLKTLPATEKDTSTMRRQLSRQAKSYLNKRANGAGRVLLDESGKLLMGLLDGTLSAEDAKRIAKATAEHDPASADDDIEVKLSDAARTILGGVRSDMRGNAQAATWIDQFQVKYRLGAFISEDGAVGVSPAHTIALAHTRAPGSVTEIAFTKCDPKLGLGPKGARGDCTGKNNKLELKSTQLLTDDGLTTFEVTAGRVRVGEKNGVDTTARLRIKFPAN